MFSKKSKNNLQDAENQPKKEQKNHKINFQN